MDEFFVYDGFELVDTLREFSYIKWTRRFSQAGDFVMETLTTDDMRRLIRTGRIIYKGTDGEAAFIEDITSVRDAQGREKLTVKGHLLNHVLDCRKDINYSASAALSAVVSEILDRYFIAPANANRKIPELRRMSYSLANDPQVSVEYAHASALDEITKLCQENSVGFRVAFNPSNKSFDFCLYEGRKTNAVFSEDMFNVLEQDYYEQTSREKTTCVVGGGGSGLIVGDEASGLARKEIYVQSAANSGQDAAQELGRRTLWDNRRIMSFDTVLNMASLQFAYKTYWDLGDIVTCENRRWSARVTQSVLEVTEYYDKGGMHLSPVFGDLVDKKTD